MTTIKERDARNGLSVIIRQVARLRLFLRRAQIPRCLHNKQVKGETYVVTRKGEQRSSALCLQKCRPRRAVAQVCYYRRALANSYGLPPYCIREHKCNAKNGARAGQVSAFAPILLTNVPLLPQICPTNDAYFQNRDGA